NFKLYSSTVGPALPNFAEQLGATAEYVLGFSLWEPLPGVLGYPGMKEYIERYEKRYGEKPNYHAGGAYGALQVTEAALKHVGAWAGTVRFDERWLGNLATVVVAGVMQGGVYAMFALGLTLIFGVMRIINAAHGEMVMMGAYLTWVCFFYLGVDPLLSMVLTLPVAFLFGVAVQKLLLNAVVGQPELTALLITFGLGLTMIYTAELIFTTDFRAIPYAPGTVHLTRTIAVGQ